MYMQFEKPSIGAEIEPIYEWLNRGRIDCVFVNGENNPSIPVADVYADVEEEDDEEEDDEV